jgi:hypothetical protein
VGIKGNKVRKWRKIPYPLDRRGKPYWSYKRQNIRDPTWIIAKYDAVKMIRTASFGVMKAVHQDMCHGKMDTTVGTDRRRLSSQQGFECQVCVCVCVTNPETCDGDFVLRDGSEGGLPHLHRRFHHLRFVATTAVPFGLPQG